MDIWTSLGQFAFFDSERLYFRPVVFTDGHNLHEIVGNPDNLRFVFPSTKTQLETEVFMVHYFMREPLGVWAICDKVQDRVIGVIRFEKINSQKRTAEFGYVLHRDYWGQGLMTEAVATLSDLALSAMGLTKLILIAHVENAASCRVAEKAGFKCVARFKGADRYTHTMRDYLRYEREGSNE